MADDLEYIDNYFSKALTPDENRQFEQRIIDDPVFAGEVAFYVAARQTALDDKKERFRQLYDELRPEQKTPPQQPYPTRIRILFPYLAAAVVVFLMIMGWLLFIQSASPQKLAESYIGSHWQTLPVTMTDKESFIQTGLRFYNNEDIPAALQQFEKAHLADSTDTKAIEYAGFAALRLQDYDKAITWFRMLEDNTRLFVNPGKFDHALALMRRNGPGDAATAKGLLQQVLQNNLAGREAANDLLKKL